MKKTFTYLLCAVILLGTLSACATTPGKVSPTPTNQVIITDTPAPTVTILPTNSIAPTKTPNVTTSPAATATKAP